MGLLRIMMPPKLQLLAVVAFAVAMLFLENQIQKLEESRSKLGAFCKEYNCLERDETRVLSWTRCLFGFCKIWCEEEANLH